MIQIKYFLLVFAILFFWLHAPNVSAENNSFKQMFDLNNKLNEIQKKELEYLNMDVQNYDYNSNLDLEKSSVFNVLMDIKMSRMSESSKQFNKDIKNVEISVRKKFLNNKKKILDFGSIVAKLTRSIKLEKKLKSIESRVFNQGVSLMTNERELTDAEDVEFAQLLAERIPIHKWDNYFVVGDSENVYTVVNAYYNLDVESNKLYRDYLTEKLIEINKITVLSVLDGRTLLMPPTPEKSEACFDSLSGSFETLSRRKTECFNYYRNRNGIKSFDLTAKEGYRNSAPGSNKDVFYATKVDLPKEVLEDLKSGYGRKIPEHVLIFSDNGMAELSVLNSAAVDSSRSAGVDVYDSRYLNESRQVIGKVNKEKTSNSAEKFPLWIVDFDFENGHGAKVLSAIELNLNRFGLNYLSKNIKKIDLDPSNSSSAIVLNSLVDSYYQYMKRKNVVIEELKRQKDRAKKWIADGEKLGGSTISNVDEFVLFSVFHRIISSVGSKKREFNKAVVSISLEFRSPALSLFLARELYDANSIYDKRLLIFVAAGESKYWEKIPKVAVPQNLAFYQNNVINVAGIGCDKSMGTASSEEFHPPIHLAYFGCGYETDFLKKDDYGSSYSTPIVASSAWVAELLTEFGNDEKFFIDKEKLIMASRPPFVGDNIQSIYSGGVFSPLALILQSSVSHMLYDGKYIKAKRCEISIRTDASKNGVYLNIRSEESVGKEYLTSIEYAAVRCDLVNENTCYWFREKRPKNINRNGFVVRQSTNLEDATVVFKHSGAKRDVSIDMKEVKKIKYAICTRSV